ncbi:MBL fold metallo-hydrolase [Methanolapillus ohkumae]|uniref:Ribonuclease n=1 Tax=Methanolapillus ohkumae TaxID=3028298 RepID=A0AA96V775_9EURY|nr:Ribonuclease [Methanosarcinaceae archaeon Am2]
MELQFLGACRDVGRSAVLVDGAVLLDYGIQVGEVTEYPEGSVDPKAVFVSHGHLDHTGAVPGLFGYGKSPLLFMTPPTRSLSEMLAKDTLKIARADRGRDACGFCPFSEDDLIQMFRQTVEIRPGEAIDLSDYDSSLNYTARTFDAGHIPGAVSIFLKDRFSKKSVYYTGDLNQQDTRLVGKATQAAHADALIIESTYFGRDHPPRGETENKFIDDILDTLHRGGCALIPAFAIGRTQEILLLLHAYGISPYIEGMGVEAYSRLIQFPDYLKNKSKKELVSAFQNSICLSPQGKPGGNAGNCGTGRNSGSSRKNGGSGGYASHQHIRHAPLNGSVILTTSGMLEGGPALYYLEKLKNDPRSRLMLTGFQAEGTNGRRILESKSFEKDGRIHRLSMQVERYDFSAHSGDSDLKKFTKSFCKNGVEKVFCIHGDDTPGFAEWIIENVGVDAYAPEIGNRFSI